MIDEDFIGGEMDRMQEGWDAAKDEIDGLRASVAELEQERDEARAERHGLGDADKFRADYRAWAKGALDAAAPLIERQVREKVAQEIEASKAHPEHEPTCQSCIVESVYLDRHATIARGGQP